MKECSYKDCHHKQWAKGLCKPHLNHLKRYGELRRLRGMGNEIKCIGDIAYITICDVHRKPTIETIIDTDDVEKVKNIYWGFNGQYVKEGTSKHVKYLHHIILGKPCKGFVIDHINRNKLDNRKSNLRFVTYSDNNRNK